MSVVRPESIPWANTIFEQPWWLDAVAPGQWGEVVVHHGDAVVARLPYGVRKRMGLTLLIQPPLTPTLGPWLAPQSGKYARQLEVEKKHMREVIERLPPFDLLELQLSPLVTNWLPFYWAGFKAGVRYTYRIDDLSDLDRVRDGFQEHVRRGIRKAEQAVEVHDELPLEELLELNARTFARQRLPVPYSDDLVRRLDAAAARHSARRIFAAVDAAGRTQAVLYVVWDEHTFYPLLNARDPEVSTAPANTLLYWEAMRLAAEVAETFDFEGSMLEPVEHFVRGFGGRQTPYFVISKRSRRGTVASVARDAQRRLDRRAR